MTNMGTNSTMKVAKGIAAGIVIGSAVCAVAMGTGMMKPKKKSIRHKTANALDTVGTIMQNIADYTR